MSEELYDTLYQNGKYRELLKLIGGQKTAEGLFISAWCYIKIGKKEAALEKVNQLLPIIPDDDHWRAKVFRLYGTVLFHLSLYSQAKKNLEISMDYYLMTGNEFGKNQARDILGIVEMYAGNFEEAEKIFNEIFQFRNRETDPTSYSFTLNNIGLTHMRTGRLKNAIEIFKEVLDISQRTNNKVHESIFLKNIGSVYLYRGELDNAMKYFDRSLSLKDNNNDFGRERVLALKAQTLTLQGELEEALAIRKMELEINYRNESPEAIGETLMNICELQLILNQNSEFDRYREMLNEHFSRHSRKLIDVFCKFVRALSLISKQRPRHILHALSILEELLENKHLRFDLEVRFSKLIIEVLLIEYQIMMMSSETMTYLSYGKSNSDLNDEIMEEISHYLNRINEIAHKQNLQLEVINLLIFKARLAKVQKKFDIAEKYYQEGLEKAMDAGLHQITREINSEIDEFYEQVKDLMSAVHTSSLGTRLKQSRIQDYFRRAMAYAEFAAE